MPVFPVPVNAPGVVAYYREYDAIWLFLQVVLLAVPATLLLSGAAPRLRDRCQRIARGRKWPTLALVSGSYLGLVGLVTLPIVWWLQVQHPASAGRTAAGTAEWLVANVTQLLATIIATALLIWIPYTLMKRFPRLWWLPTAALTWLAACSSVLVNQLLIQPRTLGFVPFPDGAMKSRFLELAARCGIHDVPISIAGGSLEGATVIGLGPTSRILISQSLIDDVTKRQSHAELVYTFGHEFKHFLFHDNLLAFAAAGLIIVTMAALVATAGQASIRRFGDRFGFSSIHDPASIPLLFGLAAAAFTFLGSPALNYVQRGVERDADLFSLELTHQNAAMASYMNSISTERSLNDFYDMFIVFRATHPSTADEVRLANRWHPWRDGQQGRFTSVCPVKSSPQS